MRDKVSRASGHVPPEPWDEGCIVATAARDGKLGVLVLKTPRVQNGDVIALVRWRDWPTCTGRRSLAGHRAGADEGGAIASAGEDVDERGRTGAALETQPAANPGTTRQAQAVTRRRRAYEQ